ncbi:MAG: trypsin-like peptidase domain-containing protein [Ruminococcus sp.]|nr:trypsin-like peptidase domain-containing protein [Ruminococcus sp.]
MYEYLNQNNTQTNGGTYYQPTPAPKQTKKGGGKKIVAMALCFSLLGGAVGTGGTYVGMRYLNNDTSAAAAKDDDSQESKTVLLTSSRISAAEAEAEVVETAVSTGKLMTAAEVYKANVNSTVGITTSIKTNYFGYETTAAASGSGFIISADGYIVTNHHVIDDANKITVTLYDGKSYEAKLIGSDESNDIAVLKIDADGLTPVVLGSSSDLSVGDEVAAIGNPLGELTFSLTAGVVSALDRTVTTQNSTMQLIQTDTAINSGNSGGALFNMYGEVVGITNAKYSSSGTNEASIDNIGFAIPIDNVKPLIESIIKNGYVVKSYIGISVAEVNEELKNYGVPEGVTVKKITENSPAEKAGLQLNDVITEVNGEKITKSSELIALVKAASKGDELSCKVYRNGSYTDITVTVDETKQETESDKQQESTTEQPQQRQRSSSGSDQFGGSDFGDIPSEFFGY